MTTLASMPSDARLWVYQNDRVLSDDEVKEIKNLGEQFVSQWAAHGASLNASFDVLYNLFVVIAVDEKQAAASGCSIDSATRFVKELEQKMNLNLLDRMQVAYRQENKIAVCKLSDFEKMAKDISMSRMMAKVHYPSDIEWGKKMADVLYKQYKKNNG